ncbi:hypothetical protein [Frankia sp. QA3]|uniref:hypothetical protein n=1 Tax=Frankia sp. QA3 TaxID=710111 RepID=UPI000269C63F|nr:hypothetical protein [Frankia sp. QA3]EIV94943.1 hypothetical protein FraQA3DRAFT_4739 [Frankia sp. QA3]
MNSADDNPVVIDAGRDTPPANGGEVTLQEPQPKGRGGWLRVAASALMVTAAAAGWAAMEARREDEARRMKETEEAARQRVTRATASTRAAVSSPLPTRRYDPAAAERARIAAGWEDARRRAQTDALMAINAANPYGWVSF